MVPALFSRVMNAIGMLAVGVFCCSSVIEAGCNCGRGGSESYGPPVYATEMSDTSSFEGDVYSGVIGDTQWMGGTAGYSLPSTPDVAPPPGTLGQTYQRPMRPIPVDRHPRISIIDVRAPGATSVRIYGTNEFRTKDGISGFQDRKDAAIWRFESEPLVPGVSHIYRVVAKYGDSAQEKYLRLVPGRIVTIDF